MNLEERIREHIEERIISSEYMTANFIDDYAEGYITTWIELKVQEMVNDCLSEHMDVYRQAIRLKIAKDIESL